MAERFPCPCCGAHDLYEVGGYDICGICGWEDDPVQSADVRCWGGANVMSLEEARAELRITGSIDFFPMRRTPYAFRRITSVDLPLINGWIASPSVAPWWDDPLEPADLAQPDHRLWIVAHVTETGSRPFAFVQDYDPHAQPGHPFAHLPPGSRGVDLFIGEADHASGGHGSALLDAFAGKLFDLGAPVVGGDPRLDNPRAIRAAEKAGFLHDRRVEVDGGAALLMTKHNPRSARPHEGGTSAPKAEGERGASSSGAGSPFARA